MATKSVIIILRPGLVRVGWSIRPPGLPITIGRIGVGRVRPRGSWHGRGMRSLGACSLIGAKLAVAGRTVSVAAWGPSSRPTGRPESPLHRAAATDALTRAKGEGCRLIAETEAVPEG